MSAANTLQSLLYIWHSPHTRHQLCAATGKLWVSHWYPDMFPEANIELTFTRGITCKAMANVHQDATKMTDYEKRFSKTHERYFINSDEALSWIRLV